MLFRHRTLSLVEVGLPVFKLVDAAFDDHSNQSGSVAIFSNLYKVLSTSDVVVTRFGGGLAEKPASPRCDDDDERGGVASKVNA